MRLVVDCLTSERQDNSSVFSRDALEDEYAVKFNKPWLFDTDEHGIKQFNTEDEACAAQRAYRVAKGLNPITGGK